MSLFAVAMLVGFSIPYFGFGSSTSASAASSVVSTSTSQAANGVTYTYRQMSLHKVYPYYITASFVVAGGLSLYAVTYIPSKAERRSRYVSRMQTWARTTY